MGQLYKIDGEKLQLGDIVRRCELIASQDRDKYFVGRETIRGRLRTGVRSWAGLTAKVQSRSQVSRRSPWKR